MKNNLMTRKNINVDKHNNIPVATFKQEDDAVLKLALFANSVVLDCTEQTIKLDVKRPDTKLVTIESGITIANKNEIDIKMTTNCFITSGLLECDLVLTDASGKMTTASFFITVNRKVTGSENIVGANVIGALDKLEYAFRDSITGMQSEYDTWKGAAIAEDKVVYFQNEINKTNSSLDNKLNKTDKIPSSQLATDTNSNKIKLVNLADEVQQAITGNAPALSVIPNKSITLEKIGFVTTGKNLLNKNTATQGKRLVYNQTTLEDNVDYFVSDYIEIEPSTQYTCKFMYGYAYYDANKVGISGHSATVAGGTNTITTIANAKYIRLNIYKTRIDTMQFEKGSVETIFENYFAYINNDYVERQPFLVDEIPNESLNIGKLNFVEYSKNLFDYTKTSEKGWYRNQTNGVAESNQYTTNLCHSDYIKVVPNSKYIINESLNSYCYFDVNKKYISGAIANASKYVLTIPINAEYVVLNIIYDNREKYQLELGQTSTVLSDYGYKLDGLIYKFKDIVNEIPSKGIGIDKLGFVEYSKNLFDYTKTSEKGWFINQASGVSQQNEYVTNWCHSDFVGVEEGKKYTVSPSIQSYIFYDGEKKYISGVVASAGNTTFTVPIGCKYVIFNIGNYENRNKYQFELGEVATAYTDFGYKLVGMIGNDDEVEKEYLSLPEKYELVVGDTFELFYKGILLSNNPYNYNFKITCSKGSAYSKRYIFTPTTSDIGTHVMTISVIDDSDKVLDSKNVDLIVKAKATNPSTTKNVLCVGDSLTVGGQWVSECCRRLTGTGGTPTGEGLSNIKFVGSVSGTNGAKFEGYGGWKYEHYNTNMVQNQQYWIATNANKPITYQKSIWKDSNNIQWVIETIEATRIKVYRNVSGTQMLPSSGSLTWVSGGDGSSNTAIAYTSVTTEAGNPFWDNTNGKVDFSVYATKIGVTSIDHCYVLLGWNSTLDSETTTKTNIRTFITNLRTSFPNCKITLLGLQVPSIDGFGANYGCAWNYIDKLKVVFNFNKWNLEVSKEFSNVDFINIAGQFDSENNIQLGTRPVNARNTKTESYGTNGVHPATEGYLQIGDAVYRNLSHKI